VRHRFTFSNVYDLPLGRNRKYGQGIPKALDFLVGGFQLNNIVTWQTGPVYNVTSSGGRVDLIGDPTPTAANIARGQQLNPAAFRTAVGKVFPWRPRHIAERSEEPAYRHARAQCLSRPAAVLLGCFAVQKLPDSFISDAFTMQFRFSAYNVLNRVNRSAPNGNLDDLTNFGIDSSEQRRRQMEFSLKLIF